MVTLQVWLHSRYGYTPGMVTLRVWLHSGGVSRRARARRVDGCPYCLRGRGGRGGVSCISEVGVMGCEDGLNEAGGRGTVPLEIGSRLELMVDSFLVARLSGGRGAAVEPTRTARGGPGYGQAVGGEFMHVVRGISGRRHLPHVLSRPPVCYEAGIAGRDSPPGLCLLCGEQRRDQMGEAGTGTGRVQRFEQEQYHSQQRGQRLSVAGVCAVQGFEPGSGSRRPHTRRGRRDFQCWTALRRGPGTAGRSRTGCTL